jgi:hypothetical protein
MPDSYSVLFRTPMLPYTTTFKEDGRALGLEEMAADILDDVRFLALSVTMPSSPLTSTTKIQNTAACEYLEDGKFISLNGAN